MNAAVNAQAYRAVGDMERPLEMSAQLIRAIAMICETIDEEDAGPLMELAWIISDKIKIAEELRGELFRLTHPNREHFNKVGWPAGPDPLLAAINDFRAGMAKFNAIPDTQDGEDHEAATYGPPLKRLEEWSTPAVTEEGALAALRLVKEELSNFERSETVGPLVSAALAFFEERG